MAESPTTHGMSASPRSAAFRALVRLELYRATISLRRTVLMAAGIAALLVLAGWGTAGRFAFILTVMGMTMLMAAVLSTLNDKVTGGLEFLVSLPVDRSILAGARLAAGAILALAASPFLTVAVLLVSGSAMAGSSPLVRFVGSWGAIFVISMLGTALGIGVSLRLRAQQFGGVFLIGFLGVTALEYAVKSALPHRRQVLLGLVTSPWFLQVVTVVVVFLTAAVGWLAYQLARTGYERYEPHRDHVQT